MCASLMWAFNLSFVSAMKEHFMAVHRNSWVAEKCLSRASFDVVLKEQSLLRQWKEWAALTCSLSLSFVGATWLQRPQPKLDSFLGEDSDTFEPCLL